LSRAETSAIRTGVTLIQIPNQRLFGPKAAARYLGVCEDTLKKMTDLGQIPAFNMNGRRAYRLEDLSAFIDSLPGWYDSNGEKSAKVVEKE
jgi:excisionase family DNA binding protein